MRVALPTPFAVIATRLSVCLVTAVPVYFARNGTVVLATVVAANAPVTRTVTQSPLRRSESRVFSRDAPLLVVSVVSAWSVAAERPASGEPLGAIAGKCRPLGAARARR